MNKLVLSEIWFYPVKSLGGIRVNTAAVKGKGLQHDRRWMLVDQQGVAMTQRVYPEMALFKPSIDDGKIHIAYTTNGSTIDSAMITPDDSPQGIRLKANVWNDRVDVIEVDKNLSQWFSDLLHYPCRLVAFPESNPRKVDPHYSINAEDVSLADAYPFLLIGQSSLDDLNKRLQERVPMNRFRPNFVFTGGAPYQEDEWKDLSIGGLRFVAVKKSARCVLTTVDQNTAVKGREPLHTLSGYRKVGNKVFFGHNLVGLDEGTVSVDDAIIPR